MLHYRSDIDGLRALAVIAVVAYHAGIPGFSGGFVGVDVFFVISGYLISGLLLNEMEATGKVDLLAFYARRIRRILPMLLLVVATTLLLALLLFPDDQKRIGRSVTSVFFFFSNHYILNKAGDYFEPGTDLVPFLHTWSLAVEEQFYFVWPLLFLVFARFHTGAVRKITLICAVALLSLLSLLGSIWLTETNMPRAFYLMPTRAWEFGFGALALCYVRYGQALPEKLAGTLALVGLLGIAFAVGSYHESMLFPGIAALLPVIATVLLLLAGTYQNGWVTRLLSSSPATAIGLLSYSWYLWHWPLMSLVRIYDLGQRDMLRDSLLALLALGLAWLTFDTVENRFRRAQGWFTTNRSTVLTGLFLSVLIVLGGALVVKWSGYQDHHIGGVYLARKDIPPLRYACHFRPWTMVDEQKLQDQPPCTLGEGKLEVVLWGDSHADHLMPLLMVANQMDALHVLQRSQGACPPLLGAAPYSNGRLNTGCADFNKKMSALTLLNAQQGAKGVILAGRWLSYVPDTRQSVRSSGEVSRILVADGEQANTDPQWVLQVFEQALQRTVDTLVAQQLRIIVMAPIPQMPFSAPTCLMRRSASDCGVPSAQFMQQKQAVMAVLSRVAGRHPSWVKVVDLSEALCSDWICPAFKEGHVLYSDDNHLTATASRSLYPVLRNELSWLAGRS
ncbi:acyltransferase family protein [Vogesella indigofera]|uniref:acyltransferase family protein n=1 Tax=Vogesella indigofera TaxID=45465 RepID=UPI00234F788C|nr:acyltransferase family protein [Vogesella indigofera]MDC7711140.1 acyltransferase family protein [Vogesella indigofera]